MGFEDNAGAYCDTRSGWTVGGSAIDSLPGRHRHLRGRRSLQLIDRSDCTWRFGRLDCQACLVHDASKAIPERAPDDMRTGRQNCIVLGAALLALSRVAGPVGHDSVVRYPWVRSISIPSGISRLNHKLFLSIGWITGYQLRNIESALHIPSRMRFLQRSYIDIELLGAVHLLCVPAAVLDFPDVHDVRLHVAYFSLPSEDDVSIPVFRAIVVGVSDVIIDIDVVALAD